MVFIGKFTEEQLKNGDDKTAIEKTQKVAPAFKYIHSKIVKTKGVTYLEVYLATVF